MKIHRLILLFIVVAFLSCVTSPAKDDLQTLEQGVDFPTGTLTGNVLWQNDSIRGVGATSTYVWIPNVGGSYLAMDGSYTLSAIAPGTYEVSAYTDGCAGQEQAKLGSVTVTVSAGSAATGSIDITPTAGRVEGHITVNGVELPNPSLVVPGLCGGVPGRNSDATGHFIDFYRPGTYTADVWGDSSRVGSFAFAIVEKQTTNVDMVTTIPDANGGATVELRGGLTSPGGLEVKFMTISAPGITTVVESGKGPAPPTGYAIVTKNEQRRYWDLATTAVYSGSIRVCIAYYPSEVANESLLELWHDDGGGLRRLSGMSIDLENHFICGETLSLSPFAVVEPLAQPDEDGDGVLDAVDQCPSTKVGSVVNGEGCSIDDLVPCNPPSKPWKNHGAYVSAYTAVADRFLAARLIDKRTRAVLVAKAAQSNCGHKK